jgi:enterobacterial common antigen flippase
MPEALTHAEATAKSCGLASPRTAPRQSSYTAILKSSAIIGGSSLLVILIGVLRVKFVALLIGPAGVGLMGAYSAIADMARNFGEMGMSRSGVRQIAQAVGTGDARRVATTMIVLRWSVLLLGLLAGTAVVLLAGPIANLTFGNHEHAFNVALLSAAVFFGVLTLGQSALLQGMRRIAEQGKVAVAGAALGTVAAVAIIYVFGQSGVVASIVATAALATLVSWWYSRRIVTPAVTMVADEVRREALAMLRLGFAFMVSGILMAGAAYAVRMFVIRESGLESAGYYQAAWTLGGLYLGFILQAMGTDFYPRLVAQVDDHAACNRMVNEQAHVSILLAGPGIIATLALAPVLVSAFYSSSFSHAVDVLRWICIGMALRVITWPLGFVVVAKNRQSVFIAIELAWTVVNVGLSWWLVQVFKLDGAGMAFFASYVFHAALVYPIVRRMTGFAWSRQNLGEIAILVGLVGAVFVGFLWLPPMAATILAAAAALASGLHSLRTLSGLIDREPLPAGLRRVLVMLRMAQR